MRISRSIIVIITGLFIIAATAYGATRLLAPKPPIQQTSNTAKASIASPILAQSETAVATRVCAKMEKIVGGLGMTPPLTLADCVEADRACVKLWGPHSVWEGAADQNNVPYCGCDDGYTWLYGTKSGSGKCVVQQ